MESGDETMTDWKDLDHDPQNNLNLLQSMERIECEVQVGLDYRFGRRRIETIGDK
jgi:hypothetical protein